MTVEFQNDDVVKTVSLDYHGGTREPHLERDASKPDLGVSAIARAEQPFEHRARVILHREGCCRSAP